MGSGTDNDFSGGFNRRAFLAGLGGLGVHSLLPAASTEKPASKPALRPLALRPLPLGQVRPTGWLRSQLRIQADGLSGHLDQFWPDIRDSAWNGGKGDGWERGPYWLDGFLPLAILLDDEKLKDRARHWIDHILKTQRDDGWLGPVNGNPTQRDIWPRFIVLKVLAQWQEATGDERVVPAMTRFLKKLNTLLDDKPLDEWARARWADLVLGIYWLHDRTDDAWLLDLAAKVHKQGIDWSNLAREFPYRDKVTKERLQEFKRQAKGKWLNDQFGTTHGVNVAMGFKAPGVWYRQSQDEADRRAVTALLHDLDRYHGQANGMFSCDEHLAGLSPSQGTELCTVVEAMFSLEVLLSILGEASLADRLERIAFNALPATFNRDMTAHQYDQQVNQVICKVSQERVYSNNGLEANIFGLAPNFGCCTANMHQGWPKFASHLWMQTTDGGLKALAYAPCTIDTKIAGKPVQIEVQTDYPFRDTIRVVVHAQEKVRFPLDLRIPGWCEAAAIAVGSDKHAGKAGTFLRLDREWSGDCEVAIKLPMPVTLRDGYNHSVTVVRGPLVYALRIGAEWRKLRGKEPFADWEVYPTTPWNYALAIDRAQPSKSVVFVERPVGKQPFSPEGAPVEAKVKGRRLPAWKLEKNAAAPPPESPVASAEPVEELILVPFGCTSLRVTEMPTLK